MNPFEIIDYFDDYQTPMRDINSQILSFPSFSTLSSSLEDKEFFNQLTIPSISIELEIPNMDKISKLEALSLAEIDRCLLLYHTLKANAYEVFKANILSIRRRGGKLEEAQDELHELTMSCSKRISNVFAPRKIIKGYMPINQEQNQILLEFIFRHSYDEKYSKEEITALSQQLRVVENTTSKCLKKRRQAIEDYKNGVTDKVEYIRIDDIETVDKLKAFIASAPDEQISSPRYEKPVEISFEIGFDLS